MGTDTTWKEVWACREGSVQECPEADESSESDLSRCDVTWTELLSKKVDLKELQAYIVLRGSKLGHEDKKRVIVESKAEQGDQLTMDNVTSAIRFLGSGFFQEYTGARRDVKSSKTYDHTAFQVDEDWTLIMRFLQPKMTCLKTKS